MQKTAPAGPPRPKPARASKAAHPSNEARPRKPERRERRALSHVGGPVRVSGDDPREVATLKHALAVHPGEEHTLEHVHGFHSYPARLHPATAARLIEGLTAHGDTLLDPFCGSGTTLVEGRLLGRKTLGVDANPLAVELSLLKSRSTSAAERAAWLEMGEGVVLHAEERRESRAGPTHRYSALDRDLFDIHVLLELDGLRDGIRKVKDTSIRAVLQLVFSAILTKASRRPGDTTERRSPRRLPSGFAIKLFSRKLVDLAQRAAAYSERVPKGTPPARVWLGDARTLEPVRARSVTLAVCSPPYPGIYDYAEQHADRLRWLGMDARGFKAREIGARRNFATLDHDTALATWRRDLGRSLEAIRRVLKPDGRAALVLADAVLAGRPVYADALLRALAPQLGLTVSACGSQDRPHFHLPTRNAFRQRPRAEHLVLLRAGGST
ncbi:MAG TPA: DNA methyltransferase [Polyangiaceae bacterium]|nr:DNA methyltransferase [Polyangiaceae bacterium]